MSNTKLQRESYMIQGGNSFESFRNEINRMLSRIGIRLDQLDAIGQNPDMKGRKIINIADGQSNNDVPSIQQTAADPNNEKKTNKNIAGGYAGLNSLSRITKGVDSLDDLILNVATKGLVLKDTQATPHYWRVTVNTSGVLVVSDVGTTKP